MAKVNGSSSWLTRSYNFIDKDPEIDKFRTIFQAERKIFRETDLAILAGLSASCVKALFGGKTRRPMHSTFAKLAGAMGYEYELQRHKDQIPDYEAELRIAREQYKVHKEYLKKQRDREERRAKKKA